MVSPASTNERVTEIGDYIFRVCFIDPFQGFVMAKFARENLKAQNVAILKDQKSDYSEWASIGPWGCSASAKGKPAPLRRPPALPKRWSGRPTT